MMDRREQIIDELLVLRCREGSQDSFRKLVERWQQRLLRHAKRLTGRDESACDVVQETWIAVTKNLDKLADPATFGRWIYRITTHKAADWQRRRGREERVESLPTQSLAVMAEKEETTSAVELLREAMNQLPPERQAILALRYVDGFDVSEVAEILNVPIGTMKSRLFHARNQLREIIERIDR